LNINFSVAQEKVTDGRYKGGTFELRKFLAENLKYPVLSQEYKSVGYSIIEVTIASDGGIVGISIINPIDRFIDENIKNVIKMTQDKWLKSDSIAINQTFYIQIAYTFSSLKDTSTVINPIKNNYNFIEPVAIIAIVGNKNNFPASDENIKSKCNESVINGKYEDASEYLDELIKRNPFNKRLYQLRITINKILKKNDLVLNDEQKLQNFIPGVSLDELIN